jgi:CRP/FNR family transcriptional regulator, cyclic AMP receptor protein
VKTSDEAQDLEQRLGSVPLLSPLSARRRRQLLDRSRVVEHDEGHQLAAEGGGALALHLILSGSVTVSTGGKELRTLRAGDYFGEISLIDGKPRSAAVTAAEPLRVLAVPYQAFQEVLDAEPAFARQLLVLLCARLREGEATG